MGQSLTRLPKEAEFEIDGWPIEIHNHCIAHEDGLTGNIMSIILKPDSDRNTLKQFEKYGISFEMVIEKCVYELEYNTTILTFYITGINEDNESYWGKVNQFSASDAGRRIAGQVIEKIRSCDDWGMLYDELHFSSRFQKEIKKKIEKEMVI